MAGLAHQMVKTAPEKYFLANFDKTKELADLAKAAGVKQFIFISTIKVFGDAGLGILTENSVCLPTDDPYGESKLKAEQYLRAQADENFKVSIIRTPLVYGPGVKGNLQKMLELCDSGKFLPFKNIRNRRTMIYVDNLVELINHLIDHNLEGLVLAGDKEPITTEQLVKSMRKHMARPVRLFSIPAPARYLIKILRPDLHTRLFGSLEMDVAFSYKKIGFEPSFSMDKGIGEMVRYYTKNKNIHR
jgi:nucleoside-diphosphate-sugar epimerase